MFFFGNTVLPICVYYVSICVCMSNIHVQLSCLSVLQNLICMIFMLYIFKVCGFFELTTSTYVSYDPYSLLALVHVSHMRLHVHVY